jgi:hypothetical protein
VDLRPGCHDNARAFEADRVRKWNPDRVSVGPNQAFRVIQPGCFDPHKDLPCIQGREILDVNLQHVGPAGPSRIRHASFSDRLYHARIM